MQIHLKETDIKLGVETKEWVLNEISKLEKFKDLFRNELWEESSSKKEKSKVQIWAEVGQSTFHHKGGKIYRAELQIHFPKKSVRAVDLEDDLRVAVTNAIKKLERQISDYKNLLVDKQKGSKR